MDALALLCGRSGLSSLPLSVDGQGRRLGRTVPARCVDMICLACTALPAVDSLSRKCSFSPLLLGGEPLRLLHTQAWRAGSKLEAAHGYYCCTVHTVQYIL